MERYGKAQFAAAIGLVANGVLGLAKITGGTLGRSSALVADGVHSLSDCGTSVAALIGLKVAAKPPDKGHPYGHGRAESITGKVVAIILIIIAVILAWNSASRLLRPHEYSAPFLGALLIAGASILIKEGLFQYKIRVAKKTGSTAIEADAWHHRSDSFSSVAAFVGIGASMAGGPKWAFMDNAAAGAVALIILWVGVSIFRKTWGELMDASAPEKTLGNLRALALEVPGVDAVEKIFARKSGLDIFVDIHIEVDPEMTVKEGHDIARRVRKHITGESDNVKNVLVHVEPHGSGADEAHLFNQPFDVIWRNFGC